MALLAAAASGVALFIAVEARVSSPLVRLAMFRTPALRASLAMSAIVTTVAMSTLVVGPFYLSQGLGLPAVKVGLVMSAGPLVSALTGAPGGRIVDRFGARRITLVGLSVMVVGCVALAVTFGVFGYVGALVTVTGGYALFQAANNTAMMREVGPAERGVTAGLVSLARNVGLITGASVMGAVFAHATGELTTAAPAHVAFGMRVTFALAAGLVLSAWLIAMSRRG